MLIDGRCELYILVLYVFCVILNEISSLRSSILGEVVSTRTTLDAHQKLHHLATHYVLLHKRFYLKLTKLTYPHLHNEQHFIKKKEEKEKRSKF